VIDDTEAHLIGDFDSGSCTPPALSSTQSVDTLSIALLKALSDFTISQGEGEAAVSTSASATAANRGEGAVGDDQGHSGIAVAQKIGKMLVLNDQFRQILVHLTRSKHTDFFFHVLPEYQRKEMLARR
jgi:hypothetical protein